MSHFLAILLISLSLLFSPVIPVEFEGEYVDFAGTPIVIHSTYGEAAIIYAAEGPVCPIFHSYDSDGNFAFPPYSLIVGGCHWATAVHS